ncbi:hypothetical protein [Parvularcula sp. LCG005]|uniref:hypothetical protein n=1 Tax=Parvularcula sp. LCG005 TaxID=3078805 RepID=UPI002943604B|nr:hypothetical protein [Parvularcula sp. LCG005]WOI51988.1 hypothetical protein RUI03_07440 [Parvularcula sp. LCG005]
MVREKIVTFGPDARLVGTMTMPDGPMVGRLLLINAGIVGRGGPHRLHVKLARAASEIGFASIRLDLSGLGDTAPAAPGLGHEQQAVADITQAIDDWNRQTSAEGLPLIVYGMCSGADHAYEAIAADDRITGLALIDPYAYGSVRARLDKIASKATDTDRWGRAIGRVIGVTPPPENAPTVDSEDNDRVHPPVEEFGERLSAFAQRGGRLFIRYTNYVQEDLTKPEHFFANFREDGFAGRLTLSVGMDVDHTHTERAAQQQLIGQLCDWLAQVAKGNAP